MKFNLRTIWAAIKEFRAVMAIVNDRDQLALAEKAEAFAKILMRLADMTSTTIDNYVLGVIQKLIPQLWPLEQAYVNRDADQLFTATVDILGTVASITDSKFDDSIHAYLESASWARTVVVAVVQRLIGTADDPPERIRDAAGRYIVLDGFPTSFAAVADPEDLYLSEVLAEEIMEVELPYSGGADDPNKNPMLILGIASLVVQLISLWRRRE